MKYLLILFAAFSALPASALLIDVAGEQWNVRSMKVDFVWGEPLITSQAWWGNQELAYSFAEATRLVAGADCDGTFEPWNVNCTSPLFGYGFQGAAVEGWWLHNVDNLGDYQVEPFSYPFGDGWYAVASRVVSTPEPGTLALLLGGGILLAAFRRRATRSARA